MGHSNYSLDAITFIAEGQFKLGLKRLSRIFNNFWVLGKGEYKVRVYTFPIWSYPVSRHQIVAYWLIKNRD